MGLSALLVSTTWAMPEPLLRGTSDRLAPRFLFVYIESFLLSMNSYGACYKSKCDMDKELLTKFQSVVDSFNRKEFTSHDFIKKFLEKYEDDYRDIFSVKTLQTTHAQLARLLSENAKALGITKSEKTLSENFHGKKSFVQGWKFLIVYLVAFVCTSMEMSAQTFLSIPNPEEDNVVMSQMYKVIRDKEYYPDDLKIMALYVKL